MHQIKYLKRFTAVLMSGVIGLSSFAQDKDAVKKEEKRPGEAEMMAMMLELAKPGENHKLLASGVGSWTYTAKMWMNPDPNAAPSESSGTSITKEEVLSPDLPDILLGKFKIALPMTVFLTK